jgi:hypothetical protein
VQGSTGKLRHDSRYGDNRDGCEGGEIGFHASHEQFSLRDLLELVRRRALVHVGSGARNIFGSAMMTTLRTGHPKSSIR